MGSIVAEHRGLVMQNEEFQVCLSIYLEEERRDEEQLSAVGGPISKVSQEI